MSDLQATFTKARAYGIGEYPNLLGKLSLEPTKKGFLDRNTAVLKQGAKANEISEVVPIALMMDVAPALSQIPHLVDAIYNHDKDNNS